MYTLEEIAALRQKCNDLKLVGREVLEKYTDEKLQKICNGIGPDAFPDSARKFITDLNPSQKPTTMLHDIDWYESNGTYEEFTRSNQRLKANGEICAKAAYGWYNPLRYMVIWKARKFATLCQYCGWEFYKGAGEKRKAECATS